nr:hypothetical protein [Pedococcus bigeumensis]
MTRLVALGGSGRQQDRARRVEILNIGKATGPPPAPAGMRATSKPST